MGNKILTPKRTNKIGMIGMLTPKILPIPSKNARMLTSDSSNLKSGLRKGEISTGKKIRPRGINPVF
jgi:hypothetical protein